MKKGIKTIELRAKSTEDLLIEAENRREDLFRARFSNATGQLGTPSKLGQLKREIAKIVTILRERELGIERKTGNK